VSPDNDKYLETYADFGGRIKQCARRLLWLPALQSLREEIGCNLRYFTLPGPRAWDVLFFGSNNLLTCNRRGFDDVCFCDNNKQNFLEAKKVLGNTPGILGNFENVILKSQKLRHKPFWDMFPFDVYNLDFCGTCFPKTEPPFSRTFKAILSLLNAHASKMNTRRTPFLILLTMKASAGITSREALSQLKTNIETNRRDNALTGQINNAVGADTKMFADAHYQEFILISIPKFLAHIAQGTGISMRVIKRGYYPRSPAGGGSTYHMTKFVFRCVYNTVSLRVCTDEYIQAVTQALDMTSIIPVAQRVAQEDTDCIEALKHSL
jgi:hypothetical protein